MNKMIALLSLMLGLSLFQPSWAVTPGKLTGGLFSTHPDWFKESFLDIAEDVEEANEEGKHVILFMHLEACPYCYRMVDENFVGSAYSADLQENFDVIAINIKGDREVALNEDVALTEKQLAQHLKVMYTPTVVFLNDQNQTVARVNGYRSVDDFEKILNFVKTRAYEEHKLEAWLNQQKASQYSLLDNPRFEATNNLQRVAHEPLAILFEDSACGDCAAFHERVLGDAEVSEILESYRVVRLDAQSEQPLVDINGNSTTPKAWAEQLGLSYRPGLLLVNDGREILRIESQLYRYHFTEILRYVAGRHYVQYPRSFYDYLDVRTTEITASGRDIDLSERF